MILDLIGLRVSVEGLMAKYAWAIHAGETYGAAAAAGGVISFIGWLLKLSLDIAYDIIVHMGFFSKIKWLTIFGLKTGLGWPVILAIAIYDLAFIFWDLKSNRCF
jgi:hypothetical protein